MFFYSQLQLFSLFFFKFLSANFHCFFNSFLTGLSQLAFSVFHSLSMPNLIVFYRLYASFHWGFFFFGFFTVCLCQLSLFFYNQSMQSVHCFFTVYLCLISLGFFVLFFYSLSMTAFIVFLRCVYACFQCFLQSVYANFSCFLMS